MTLAFAKAVERVRGQPVTVFVPPNHRSIAAMFPDVPVIEGQPDGNFCATHEVIIAHPSSVPKRVRIDHLCLLSRRLTHADLWRAMLELPHDEPFRRGAVPAAAREERSVLLIPTARSMPNDHGHFWNRLAEALIGAGWSVRIHDDGNDPDSLRVLFERCAIAEWVIGPQCGVTSIVCHAMYPCRKTFAVPSVDGHSYFRQTYPYAYVGTFAGEDYADLEEVKITVDVDRAVADVMSGANAARITRGGLISGVQMTLTHGDFFDRLSILSIKAERLTGYRRSLMYREYLQHAQAAEPVLARYGEPLASAYAKIREANAAAWDHNERAVGGVFSPAVIGPTGDDFAEAARHNRERVRLKNQINAICSSSFDEVKSYYGGEDA